MVNLFFGKHLIFPKNTTQQKPTPNPVAKGLEDDVPGIFPVTWVKKQNKTKSINNYLC